MADFNEIKTFKDWILSISKRGFLYFLKNIFIIAGVGVLIYLLINFDYTVKLFQEHTQEAISGVVILLVAIFELARSEAYGDKHSTKDIVNEVKNFYKQEESDREKKHDDLMKYRFAIGPMISNTLKDLIITTGASRASLIEMHNGTNSLSGIPFVYGDMVYEETDKDVVYTMDEYKDFNLSRYPFIVLHYYEGSWFGSVEDIKNIDKMLYSRMSFFGTKYFGFMTINGLNGPIGFLTISFKDDEIPSTKKIITELGIASQKITALLENSKI